MLNFLRWYWDNWDAIDTLLAGVLGALVVVWVFGPFR